MNRNKVLFVIGTALALVLILLVHDSFTSRLSGKDLQSSDIQHTLSRFTFFTPSTWYIQTLYTEGVNYEGNLVLQPDRDTSLFVFTTNAPFSSFNPEATSLSDYKSNYSSGESLKKEVEISSNKDVVINGIPMLKQSFSTIHRQYNTDGSINFEDRSEDDVENAVRYIFFDGSGFVIVMSGDDTPYVETLIRTVALI